MNRTLLQSLLAVAGLLCSVPARADLDQEFRTPPDTAKVWCYWWWLNGAASPEGITRDFEEMRKQGIAGALLFDAGEAGTEAPRGSFFMSPAWRELYQHAVREAARLGITLGVNLCSGWNAGGPWITPEHAAKKLVSSHVTVKGPGPISTALPLPEAVDGFYRDIAVLAHPTSDRGSPEPKLSASSSYRDYRPGLAVDDDDRTRWTSNGDQPGMGPTPEKPEYLQFDYAEPWTAAGLYLQPYTDCGPKEIDLQCSDDGQTYRSLKRATLAPQQPITIPFDDTRARHFRVVFRSAHPHQGKDNWNVQVAEIELLTRRDREAASATRRNAWDRRRTLDVTASMNADGRLSWEAPAGTWSILRLGYTLHNNPVKCVGSGPVGPELDPMSAAAMDAHFAETGAKLIADAGPLAGQSLQYFHIDSWELGQPTWTPAMRHEFAQRRGYDPLLYLPALVKRTVDDSETTQRFLADYRRTAADLIAAHYYGRLRELTLQGGLRGIHPESGGPFFDHWIDGLQCAGINDIPMGEFWKRNREPDGPITWPPQTNPTIKQIACAAHIYGKPVCQAEAFTSFADDWTDDPWSMKDIGDEAFCHGLTRNVLCFYVHQPRLDAKPGFQWAHVGTHFDRNITWWDLSGAWLTYLARCQHLLRQGRFVADFAYLQSEDIPSFIAPRDQQKPARPPGFDYDVLNAEVLLGRAMAKDGRLTLPDGMSYRYLVLPERSPFALSPAVLRRIKELTEGGVTLVGPKPDRAQGLTGFPASDREVKRFADDLWGPAASPAGERKAGQGRVIWGRSLAEVVQADALAPDVEFLQATASSRFDWIHRQDGSTDLYFISNQAAAPAAAEVAFRATGRQPELWDAVTAEMRDLPVWREEAGRTFVPLEFAPRQSFFVVFRKPSTARPAAVATNFPRTRSVLELAGSWEIAFAPEWGGPAKVVFERLDDWTQRPEDGIRYYSGTAVYRKRFELPDLRPAGRLFLALGTVHNLARVKLNGREAGVVWTAPWQTEITTAARAGANDLEVEVVNLWPNRLIGDATLPKEKRFTVTNVRTYDTMASGTYGCKTCEARQKSGQPAALLPSGLLGPVTVQEME